ncbi:probable E3 ubiquitin-protein ligase ZFP1 [Lathyrus oleraceus]|uniref:probable E3 ubiquitin-protein ligase ZFP1 n=1 Tax=Pisum sativum TaxID=3888 RepID=UPI001FC51FF4|nr:probable E3 ubiquitin-protein ligase ZFP1 [Pisum sativum]
MAEEGSIGYSFSVYTTHGLHSKNRQPRPIPVASDFFNFQVTAYLRDFSSPPMTVSVMFRTSIRINCNEFFLHDQSFLWLYLQGFSSPYFNSENLSEMTLNLIPKVKRLFFPFDIHELAAPVSNHIIQEIPLFLTIIVEERRTAEEMMMIREPAVIEESMQSEKRIPASNDAILSLKAYSLPRNCCICMEKFHDELEEGGDSDDVRISTMACGHIFHYNCIVKWLQTSHVCPLCRYAMPI